MTGFDEAQSHEMADEEDTDELNPSEPIRRMRPVLVILQWTLIVYIIALFVTALWIGGYAAVSALQESNALPDWLAEVAYSVFGIPEIYVDTVYYGVILITMTVYLWFVMRAVSNLRAFSPRYIGASPLGSVVWHFVPVLNLVKPYQIMRMLWVHAHDPLAGEGKPPDAAVWWWWLWLGAAFTAWLFGLARLSMYDAIAEGGDGMAEFYRASFLTVMSHVIQAASALFLFPLIKGIADAQDGIAKAREF